VFIKPSSLKVILHLTIRFSLGGDPNGYFETGKTTNILKVVNAVDRDCGDECQT
jgi:hypothetical protein